MFNLGLVCLIWLLMLQGLVWPRHHLGLTPPIFLGAFSEGCPPQLVCHLVLLLAVLLSTSHYSGVQTHFDLAATNQRPCYRLCTPINGSWS